MGDLPLSHLSPLLFIYFILFYFIFIVCRRTYRQHMLRRAASKTMKTSYIISRLTNPTSAPPRKFFASVSTTLSITRFSTFWVSVCTCIAFRSCEISFLRQAIPFSGERFNSASLKKGFYLKSTIHCLPVSTWCTV